jgi:hypothetical protein
MTPADAIPLMGAVHVGALALRVAMWKREPDLGRRCRAQAQILAAHARHELAPDALLAAIELEVSWPFQGFRGGPASWVHASLDPAPVLALLAGWRAMLHAASDTGEDPDLAWRWFDVAEVLPIELLNHGPEDVEASLSDSARLYLPVMAMWRVWRAHQRGR